MKLPGKVALVTGASRGIGKRIAIELAREGADVAVAARTVERRKRLPGTVGETIAEVEAQGRRCVGVAADVTRPEDLTRLVQTSMDELGRIDVLVNNAAFTAGPEWGAALEDIVLDDWLMQYATNVHAPFLLMQKVIPVMKRQGGGIVINITSGAGDLEDPTNDESGEAFVSGNPALGYTSSKAALNRLANALAPSLRRHNVTVVNLDPGFVRTEMVDLMVEKGLDASRSHGMDVPANAVVQIVTSDDPLRYSGRVVRAVDF